MKFYESLLLLLCLSTSTVAQRGSSTSGSSSSGGYYSSSSGYHYTSSGYSSSGDSSNMSAGAICGIVVGGIVAAGCLCCILAGKASTAKPTAQQQTNQRQAEAAFDLRAKAHSANAVPSMMKLDKYTNFNGHFSQGRVSYAYSGSIKIHPAKNDVHYFTMKGTDKFGTWTTSGRASLCVNKQDKVGIAFVKRYAGNGQYNVYYEGTGSARHGSLVEFTGTWKIFGEDSGTMTLSLSMPISETKCFMQSHTQYV